MHFFTTLSAATIVALAAAIPVADEPSNIPAPFDMELPAGLPTASDGAVVWYSGEASAKRSMEKRSDTKIEVWASTNKRGRHETLHSDFNKCYNLGNGWNDDIESVTVYATTGCVFYNKGNCNKDDSNGRRLTVSGTATTGTHVASLLDGGSGGLNNMVSSYLCFRI
ncbi:hypothetical protein BDW02DRAFT_567224 [Decorospora gaudefroyi]|uniref:Uncharacterized protein n=1 Tax=Decorospora gaudefroyi TaxID=184978 RepID=A0A6A5KJ94_9PLEO|nr:hypothetical protein BDW02DRAFT_567224 [Decorospora gaudefroyi]